MVKTCLLCRYLVDEALRREINDGLNVVEHWNSANDFVLFARCGEKALPFWLPVGCGHATDLHELF